MVSAQVSISPHLQRPTNMDLPWYAIQTRSRHEKTVARQLDGNGINHFLPLITEMHRWRDRKKQVEVPLFPGYVFVQIVPAQRLSVLRAEGVVNFVGTPKSQGETIPASQIDEIRNVLSSDIPVSSHPFLTFGHRVRIRGGALDGLEGILDSQNGARHLVISMEPIQKSISICIDDYALEPA